VAKEDPAARLFEPLGAGDTPGWEEGLSHSEKASG